MSDLKKITTPTLDNVEIEKYLRHPLIAPLHLTQSEFRRNTAIIKKMIDEPNFGIKLIRDEKGNLKLKAFSDEKTLQLENIRKRYLVRNFPDVDLDIMLNYNFFPPKIVNSNKGELLRMYKGFLSSYPQHG
jgi:hypothetical protein